MGTNDTQETNPKKAFGELKAPMGYAPKTAIIEMAAVMAGGAHKYGAYNFRDTKIDAMTYIGAIERHLALWEDGVDVDQESGRSHLAHIMACCGLALDAMHTGMFVDNRSKTGVVEGLLRDCAESHNGFASNNESVEERLSPATTDFPDFPYVNLKDTNWNQCDTGPQVEHKENSKVNPTPSELKDDLMKDVLRRRGWWGLNCDSAPWVEHKEPT